MIEFIDEKVTLHPAHKAFFKDVPKKELQGLIEYLYYYYIDPNYQDVLPTERYEIIVKDYCKGFEIEKHSDIIAKFESIILSPTQKLATAHLKKIEEIIKLFYDTPIESLEQLETQAKLMASIDKLYVISDKLNTILAKEGKSGKGKGSKQISEAEEDNFDDV